MPTLDFKGKQHIYPLHLTVPYRPVSFDPFYYLTPPGLGWTGYAGPVRIRRGHYD